MGEYMAKNCIIDTTAELNKRIDDVLMELDIQNNKTKKEDTTTRR